MKTLREAIPHLMTTEWIMERADQIMIDRMTMPRSRDMLKIYLHAPFLIAKRDIFTLEAAIKKQNFKNKAVAVRIYEQFDLPEMTPQEAFAAYRESILLELKTFRLFEYNLFRNAALEFTEPGIALLILPDTLINAEKGRRLAEYLTGVFTERLGFSLEIRLRTRPLPERKTDQADAEADAARISASYQAAQEAAQAALRSQQKEGEKPKRTYPKRRLLSEEEGWGTDFDGDPIPLAEITDEMGDVVIHGQVIKQEMRTLQNGNLLYIFVLTDKTDSIKVKLFAKPEEQERVEALIAPGCFIRLKATAAMDHYEREIAMAGVRGIRHEEGRSVVRQDSAPIKRVELHAHTQMSEMDAVMHTEDYIRRAADWGHKAVAITDHGVVYSFPEASHVQEALAREGKPIKIIYGCEGYLVDDKPGMSREDILKLPTYHIILLAKNDTGRVNLYRMVSESHLNYFRRRPRIPRSLLSECREGIIVGSACEAGELFRALLREADEEELAKIVRFYDYLEVQPIGNNEYLTRTGRDGKKYSREDLRNFVRRIVDLGEQFGKPVAATCDVHFMDPEDEVYRRILQAGMKFTDADYQPPLYFRTTEEMLAEFDFLPPEVAKRIVIETPNEIADSVENISPVRPDKCPPSIPGSEEELERRCYARAHEWYGEELPPEVKNRLETELKSIISNGYAVMYIIAQRLVKKSNDEGYIVGSRGSVGSSLVATLSGISEVNPLPPHYRCPNCRHSIFHNEETARHAGGAGVDMQPLDCPVCGTRMIQDGYDIPFETFLGFNGDKEPDIDLNFSGEYQAKAHKYTEELFGKGCTFKAGTIGSLQEKNAFGYTLHYFEERGIHKRSCEIDRIAAGCVGTRKTTGQHPGGIVVMPRGENIYSFTPIQHPANDDSQGIITTHFDYHSIEHNLLKLDILGHDDPTMIVRLEALTGIPYTDIPIHDEGVLGLFQSCGPLGIRSEDIGGCPLGTLGVPEFGTDFAMGIVQDAKPTCVADLVRIAGIAHGTNVWRGNVQDLIVSGTATLREAICTRDDIMLYLISRGIEPATAFQIMESVRKGKVARGAEKKWPAWKESLLEHGVPEWYTGSAEKIEYMFPKAHAAAYVMMALRVAYNKVYHPLEYYTAYFSIRADGFDYAMMGRGKEILAQHLDLFRRNKDRLSDTELRTLRDMRIVEEMYARGIEFMPIDLYKAGARDFRIYDGKIMPSFSSISGMGEKAAESLAQAAAGGPFLSKEDLISRSRISSTLADTMQELGILGKMRESNQMSLEDLMLL